VQLNSARSLCARSTYGLRVTLYCFQVCVLCEEGYQNNTTSAVTNQMQVDRGRLKDAAVGFATGCAIAALVAAGAAVVSRKGGAAKPEDDDEGLRKPPRTPFDNIPAQQAHPTAPLDRTLVDTDTAELRLEQFSRNRQFFGDACQAGIERAFVIVVGVGGVGSHAAHMLARAGVGRMRFIDFDQVTLSSLNRHAVATRADVGTAKVAALAKALAATVPSCSVECVQRVFDAVHAAELLAGEPDFVLDCIDDRETKMALLHYCWSRRLRCISSLGAGGRADPTRICIADLAAVQGENLSTRMRLLMRRDGKCGFRSYRDVAAAASGSAAAAAGEAEGGEGAGGGGDDQAASGSGAGAGRGRDSDPKDGMAAAAASARAPSAPAAATASAPPAHEEVADDGEEEGGGLSEGKGSGAGAGDRAHLPGAAAGVDGSDVDDEEGERVESAIALARHKRRQERSAARSARGARGGAVSAGGGRGGEDDADRAPPEGDRLTGIMCVYSSEVPRASLLPLPELAEGESAADIGAMPGFRVRVMPVLGCLPAIFGQAMAAHVLCELAGGEHSLSLPPSSATLEGAALGHHAVQKAFQAAAMRDATLYRNARGTPFHVEDAAFLLNEAWRQRSALTPERVGTKVKGAKAKPMALVRWRLDRPSLPSNLVLVLQDEAEAAHAAAEAGLQAALAELDAAREACCGASAGAGSRGRGSEHGRARQAAGSDAEECLCAIANTAACRATAAADGSPAAAAAHTHTGAARGAGRHAHTTSHAPAAAGGACCCLPAEVVDSLRSWWRLHTPYTPARELVNEGRRPAWLEERLQRHADDAYTAVFGAGAVSWVRARQAWVRSVGYQ